MPPIQEKNLSASLTKILQQTKVTDIHTHLYDPHFSGFVSKGIDELLTYHYLIAENFRTIDMSYEAFWKLTKPQQAELVWKNCFLDHSPVSESCRGVLTSLQCLGLDTTNRDINYYRKQLASIPTSEYIDRVFSLAGVESVVMTNDPFDEAERTSWEKGFTRDSRFKAGLRLDLLLLSWDKACPRLKTMGYSVEEKLTPVTLKEIRRFLSDWITKLDALYLMVSFPPPFAYPGSSTTSRLLTEAVLPVCGEMNKPFALMVGVNRQVNPELKQAGDGVGQASIDTLEQLCRDFPQNKFMATYLSRENQHGLAVAARKFKNLMVFGCWWFLNIPSLMEEITRMRLELLGTSFIPNHSDARVLDQLIYKWDTTREVLHKVLMEKYTALIKTGWTVTEEEVKRDVEGMLKNNFRKFVEEKV